MSGDRPSAETDDGRPLSLWPSTDCRDCQEVALAYDPAEEAPRCRACGRLASIHARSR